MIVGQDRPLATYLLKIEDVGLRMRR